MWFSAGKEVVLLMQALNSLATPEEKLAALCKKYADLVSYTNIKYHWKGVEVGQEGIVELNDLSW